MGMMGGVRLFPCQLILREMYRMSALVIDGSLQEGMQYDMFCLYTPGEKMAQRMKL
jgi:hypothetical protein